MLNSSKRKQALAGWLKTKDPEEFADPLKLQKFLFFYEIVSKIEDQEYELTKLKGYAAGPVFSDVYGDYRHNREMFNQAIIAILNEDEVVINEDIATFSLFLIQTHTREDLSELTHDLDIWHAQAHRIEWGEWQVTLHESDLSEQDIEYIKNIRWMFPKSYIENHKAVSVGNKRFIFSKDDYENLTQIHYSTLNELVEKVSEQLINPVYTEIDIDGGLLVYD